MAKDYAPLGVVAVVVLLLLLISSSGCSSTTSTTAPSDQAIRLGARLELTEQRLRAETQRHDQARERLADLEGLLSGPIRQHLSDLENENRLLRELLREYEGETYVH